MAPPLERDPTSGSLGMFVGWPSGGDHRIFFTALDESKTVGLVAVHWEGLSGSVDMLVVSFEGDDERTQPPGASYLSRTFKGAKDFVQQMPSHRDVA